MKSPNPILLLTTFAISVLARDSTITCDPCEPPTDVKWCQRCYTSPTHCSLPFSLPCDATVDEVCAGALDDCIHYPDASAS